MFPTGRYKARRSHCRTNDDWKTDYREVSVSVDRNTATEKTLTLNKTQGVGKSLPEAQGKRLELQTTTKTQGPCPGFNVF